MARRLVTEIVDLAAIQAQHDKTIALLKNLDSAIVTVQKNVAGAGGSGGSKSINEMASAISVLEKEEKKLAETQQASYQYQQQLTQQRKEAEKQAKLEAQASNELVGAYKRMEAQAALATIRAKDLAAQYGVNSKEAKVAAKEANALNTNLKTIDKTMSLHQRNVGNYTQGLKRLGATMLAAFSIRAISSFFKSSLENYDIQIAAETKLATILKSTGNAAKYTADELINMAKALQEATRFGDEEIINVQALLATFTNIGHDALPQATEIILDLSTVLKQDLQSSAVQVGKALNDPIKGVTALRRVGVSFNDEQLVMIKRLQSSGDLMGAQKIILSELQKEFGGTARAMAAVGMGPLKQLTNSWGDFKESVGESITSGGIFSGLIGSLRSMVEWMTRNIDAIVIITKQVARVVLGVLVWKGAVILFNSAMLIKNTLMAIAVRGMNLFRAATNASTVATEANTVAQKASNTAQKSNIWGLIASAIAIAATYLWEYLSSLKDSNKFQKQMNKELSEGVGKFEAIKKSILGAAQGSKERAAAIKEMNENYGDLIGYQLKESSNNDQIANSLEGVNEKIREKILLEMKSALMTDYETKKIELSINISQNKKLLEQEEKRLEILKTQTVAQGATSNAYIGHINIINAYKKKLIELTNESKENDKALAERQLLLDAEITKMKEITSATSSASTATTDYTRLSIEELEALSDAGDEAAKKEIKRRKDSESAADKAAKKLEEYIKKQKELNELLGETQISGLVGTEKIKAENDAALAAIDEFEKELYKLGVEAKGAGFKLEQQDIDRLNKLRELANNKEKQDIQRINEEKAREREKYLKEVWDFERAEFERKQELAKKEFELNQQLEEKKFNEIKRGEKEIADFKMQQANNAVQFETDLIQKQIEFLQKYSSMGIFDDVIEDLQNKLKELALSTQIKISESFFEANKAAVDNIVKTIDVLKDALGAYYEYINTMEGRKSDEIDKSNDEQKKSLQRKLDQGVISQEVYNARVEQLDKQAAAAKEEIAKKAAKRKKDMAIIDATIGLAQATLQAYIAGVEAGGPGGLITGAVFSAVAAAFAALQLGLIIATPAYAKGRRSGPAEDAIVGERGFELIQSRAGQLYKTPDRATLTHLAEGDRVYTHEESLRLEKAIGVEGVRAYHGNKEGRAGVELLGKLTDIERTLREKPTAVINMDKHGLSFMLSNGSRISKHIENHILYKR